MDDGSCPFKDDFSDIGGGKYIDHPPFGGTSEPMNQPPERPKWYNA